MEAAAESYKCNETRNELTDRHASADVMLGWGKEGKWPCSMIFASVTAVFVCCERAVLGRSSEKAEKPLSSWILAELARRDHFKGFCGSQNNKRKMAVDNFGDVVHVHITKELDMSAVDNCVCFNLRRVTRIATQFYDSEMRRHGIRPTQGTILLALNAKESWTMAELSDCLGLERTSLVRNLQPLQRDGLVTADGGGRGNRVELAIRAKGRKQVEKFMPAWESVQSTAVQALGEKRWSALLADLEKVACALKNKKKPNPLHPRHGAHHHE